MCAESGILWFDCVESTYLDKQSRGEVLDVPVLYVWKILTSTCPCNCLFPSSLAHVVVSPTIADLIHFIKSNCHKVLRNHYVCLFVVEKQLSQSLVFSHCNSVSTYWIELLWKLLATFFLSLDSFAELKDYLQDWLWSMTWIFIDASESHLGLIVAGCARVISGHDCDQ